METREAQKRKKPRDEFLREALAMKEMKCSNKEIKEKTGCARSAVQRFVVSVTRIVPQP